MADVLVEAAIDILPMAYAPYSQFEVGAAIQDEKGHIHLGVNVENAAYPVGSCAEAGAIAAMIAAGGKQISRLAVAGRGAALCPPFGCCRQRLREFAAPDMEIRVCDDKGLRKLFTLETLHPHTFRPGTPDPVMYTM